MIYKHYFGAEDILESTVAALHSFSGDCVHFLHNIRLNEALLELFLVCLIFGDGINEFLLGFFANIVDFVSFFVTVVDSGLAGISVDQEIGKAELLAHVDEECISILVLP